MCVHTSPCLCVTVCTMFPRPTLLQCCILTVQNGTYIAMSSCVYILVHILVHVPMCMALFYIIIIILALSHANVPLFYKIFSANSILLSHL